MAQRLLNGNVLVETHFGTESTTYLVTLMEEWARGLPAANVTPRGKFIYWVNSASFPEESIPSVREVLEELIREELSPGDNIPYQLKIVAYGAAHSN